MKNINKITQFFTLLFAASLVFVSCETTDLDLLDDPNNVTVDKASVDRFMSRIQLDFNAFTRILGDVGAEVTRIEYMFGRQYNNVYEPANLDVTWRLTYANMFSDIAAMESIAGEDFNNHLGVAKILQGISYIILVDNFGDVPFSEATQPAEFPAPNADPGADVYAGAINLIDEGIALLGSGPNMENDFFYNNDFSKWRKAGNTFKMYAYLNTGNTAEFNAIAGNPGNYISNASDDFQFQYGANETNPDTRHPAYAGGITPQGVSGYRSVWLMGTMQNLGDPRMRYYFYRQRDCTPGASCDPDGNEQQLPCSVQTAPVHYGDGFFCYLEDGYWGRDHGVNDGIPQDGFQKTAVGVYPYGGKFDGDNFESVAVGVGAGGAGINPVMLSSWVNFMRAEVALNGGGGNAATDLGAGITASVNKALSFGSLDPDADASFFPTSSEVTAYTNSIVNSFNNANADGKFEILATQFFIASYGNGLGAYNFYRRTGFPRNLQPNIEPNPGGFIRSHYYPANEANTNGNIVQKLDVIQQVFWDTNPSSPGFPSAN